VSHEQAKAALQPFFKGILDLEVKEAAFRNASVEAREAFLKNVLDVLPGGQGRSYLRRQLQAPFSVLLGLIAGVLLIACANVAGLLGPGRREKRWRCAALARARPPVRLAGESRRRRPGGRAWGYPTDLPGHDVARHRAPACGPPLTRALLFTAPYGLTAVSPASCPLPSTRLNLAPP
jgi:hypothetical protein